MRKSVSIFGAGGHGKVVADVVGAMDYHLKCVYDNNPKAEAIAGVSVSDAATVGLIDTPVIITVGNNLTRKNIAEDLEKKGIIFETAIHPSAIIAKDVKIGEGSVVFHGAIIQSGAVIGKHCIINSGAIIEHDCKIGDYAHISPGATLCGMVTVGEGTWIGASSVVIQCLKIGKWSVIGAGSVVIRNLGDNVVAAGNPAKIIK